MFFHDIFKCGISQNKCDYFDFERLTSVQIIHDIFCKKTVNESVYSYIP